eukprot:11645-Heterococcus_DN1.PRE.3
MSSINEFELKNAAGETTTIPKAKATVIVNTASACGYTKHYAGLQALYAKYADKGLLVAAFPCNQFGGQEPKSIEEITEFVKDKYSVTFPVYNKLEVNGDGEHPLFSYLKSVETVGDSGDIKWNFTKWLCNSEGVPVKRYEHREDPLTMEADIEALLK